MALEERVAKLEKRVAALEEQLRPRGLAVKIDGTIIADAVRRGIISSMNPSTDDIA